MIGIHTTIPFIYSSYKTSSKRRQHICLKFANSLTSSNVFREWLPKTRGDSNGRSLRNSHLFTTLNVHTKRHAKSAIPYMTKLLNENFVQLILNVFLFVFVFAVIFFCSSHLVEFLCTFYALLL